MKIDNYNDLIKYVQKYKNNPKKMSAIKQNFSEYIQLCDEQNIMNFINEIKGIPEMQNTLYYYSRIIYEKFDIEVILKMTQGMPFVKRFYYIEEIYSKIGRMFYTIDEYIEDLAKYNEVEYIFNNMDEIMENGYLKKYIENGLLKKLKQIDSKKFEQVHSSIVAKMTRMKPKNIGDKTLTSLTMIVDEVAQNENVDISDLEYVDKGCYSTVYKLGNKVIKFGEKRLTDKIPYNKRILQPLLRRQISTKGKILYIEIAEYIKPDNEITEEDVYLIYKELREEGIIWLDAKGNNLGRLNKENIAQFKEPLYVKNESVGYIPETIKEEKPLQEGDLVIIDTDFLFREEEFDEDSLSYCINTDFYHKYETRYLKEKNKQKCEDTIDKSDSKKEDKLKNELESIIER